MLRVLLLTMLFSFSFQASAAQILDVVNADTDVLTAKISNYDSNKIRIAGGYITMAAGPNNGLVSIEKDEANGHIYVRLNNPASKRFTLFVTSRTGRSYTVLLSPRNIPGQAIIIKPHFHSKRITSHPIGISARVSRIKHVMKTIANHDIPKHCDMREKDILIPWWKNTKFRMERQFDCGQWIVDQYSLDNQSKETLNIAEQEFFHDGVISVAIDHSYLSGSMALKGHESTKVWVIRDKHHD